MELSSHSSALSHIASLMVVSGVFFILVFACVFFALRLYLRQKANQASIADGSKYKIVAFFHPYCNAGGGGERVLWVGIKSVQKRFPNVKCVVYTGDIDATPQEILAKAHDRFNISLSRPVEFVFLKTRHWVEASKYPYFTLLGQSLGSLVLGLEALFKRVPDVYIDTMGYSFTLPLFKYLANATACCYVHYPTISTDMLSRVSERIEAHNNSSVISKSPLLSYVKLKYYQIFAYLYGVAGKRSELIMVNSTWTYNHISSLWKAPSKIYIVYPPCDIAKLVKIPITPKTRNLKIVLSLGQFRPEKDHPLQLKSFKKFLDGVDDTSKSDYKLVLAGSCRNQGDENRVQDLKKLSRQLQIDKYIDFQLNITFGELKQLLADSTVSIHTMWNEHFGICVVEGMAAGTVMLAHDSGGPKLDIVVNYHDKPTGFLASDVDSYAAALTKIFNMTSEDTMELCQNARESLSRFSEEEFETVFLELFGPFLEDTK